MVVPMLANAATPLRYHAVFNEDLISRFQDAETDTTKGFNAIPELAFIMAKAAEAKDGKADMTKLNQDTFIVWLEQFDPMDLPEAAEDIVNLYLGNTATHSEPKKNKKGAPKES